MAQFIRFFLPWFFTAYILICVVMRTLWVWKNSGVFPIVLGNSDSVYDFIGRVLKISLGLSVVVVVAYTWFPSFYDHLGVISILETGGLRAIGLVLLLASFVWTTVAQMNMGDSLRIGIDFKSKTDLATGGLFKVSRNPIFVGMLATLFGFFLTLPNALTLTMAAVGFVVIQIQVRLEEEFLTKQHGLPYVQYCLAVRRWL